MSKNSWRESANERRDFRHTKDEEENNKGKSRKNKKPFLIEYRYVGTGRSIFGNKNWGSFSRYVKERDAKKALTTLRTSTTWGPNWEFRLLNEQKEVIG